MSAIVRRRRITAASPTPEKLATFLRHLEESGSVSFAAERTGIGRACDGTERELRRRGQRVVANNPNNLNTNRIEDALVSFLACLKGPDYRRFFRG